MSRTKKLFIYVLLLFFACSLIIATQVNLVGATGDDEEYVPNVGFADFRAVYAQQATFAEVDGGVNISLPDFSSRITYEKAKPIDGMNIYLTDIEAATPTANDEVAVLAFNITNIAGHYFASGATGTYFSLTTSYSDGQLKTFLLARKAALSYTFSYPNDDVYIHYQEITVFPDNIIPDSLLINFKKVGDNYEIDINGQKFSMAAQALEGNLSDSTGYVVFGGFNAKMPVSGLPTPYTNFKYTVHTVGDFMKKSDTTTQYPIIDGPATTPTIGKSNIVTGNLEDTFATGIIISDHANGVKLTSNAASKRATVNYLNTASGMIIRLSDISLSAASGSAGVAFTLTSSRGHFYGPGTEGVYFRIYTQKVNGQNKVFMLIKEGAAADNADTGVYLPPTILGAFGAEIPKDIEIKFVHNISTSNYDITVNNIKIELPEKNIIDNIFATGRTYISFGTYSTDNSQLSMVINHVGPEENTAVNGNGNTTDSTIKILAIGNSFSVDAGAFLSDIARAANIKIVLGIASIGGSTLQDHWNAIEAQSNPYQYRITDGPFIQHQKLEDLLSKEDWEYVILQQASHYSGMWETFEPYLSDIANYISQQLPDAELLIHQTWAYEKTSSHSGFVNYDNSQEIMYNGIVESYNNAAQALNARLIPCGDAMQIARGLGSFNQDEKRYTPLTADGYHASVVQGRYLLGAVWYEFFTGNSILENTLTLAGVTTEEMDILRRAAHIALNGDIDDPDDDPDNTDGKPSDNGGDQKPNGKDSAKCSAFVLNNSIVIMIAATAIIAVFARKRERSSK